MPLFNSGILHIHTHTHTFHAIRWFSVAVWTLYISVSNFDLHLKYPSNHAHAHAHARHINAFSFFHICYLVLSMYLSSSFNSIKCRTYLWDFTSVICALYRHKSTHNWLVYGLFPLKTFTKKKTISNDGFKQLKSIIKYLPPTVNNVITCGRCHYTSSS